MKEKLFNSACPALANAQRRAGLKEKILSLCIPYTQSSLNLIQVPAPGYTLNNLNRDRRLQIWSLGQMGNLHSKDIARFISQVCQGCSFTMVVTRGHLAHLAELRFPQEENSVCGMPGLNIDGDPARPL